MQDGYEHGDVEQTYDSDGHSSLTTFLVDAIADYKGTDPANPGFLLYETLDTDALEDLFASVSGDAELRTAFRVKDVTVHVYRNSNEKIAVTVQDSDLQAVS